MKHSILLLLLLTIVSVTRAQELSVSIELNKNSFKRDYYSSVYDSMQVIIKIKNNGSRNVKLRNAHSFDVSYGGEDREFISHCFSLHSDDKIEQIIKPDYQRTKDAFVEIKPGEEFISGGNFSVGWLCRGAPPQRPWKLYMYYYRDITPQDNYTMYKSYYTEKYEKEFVDAWVGLLKSEPVEIVIE